LYYGIFHEELEHPQILVFVGAPGTYLWQIFRDDYTIHKNWNNPHHSNSNVLPPGNSPVCVSGHCCSQREDKYAHITNTHCNPSPTTQQNSGTLRKYITNVNQG